MECIQILFEEVLRRKKNPMSDGLLLYLISNLKKIREERKN